MTSYRRTTENNRIARYYDLPRIFFSFAMIFCWFVRVAAAIGYASPVSVILKPLAFMLATSPAFSTDFT